MDPGASQLDSPIASAAASIASIQRYIRAWRQLERCELCGKDILAEHEHMIEPSTRKILCACGACAMLFDSAGARYRRIPHRIEQLAAFQISEATWESLHLPINLAFFYRSSTAGRMVALFPSPAGATESTLPEGAWPDLCAANPILTTLQDDVEALLINRTGRDHEYWLVPIDECFKLVGVIRTHWRGLSGGTEVWREIAEFYQSLQQRSTGARNA